jgi:heme/copper-type cytochrome/quinol oxidase subunit 2
MQYYIQLGLYFNRTVISPMTKVAVILAISTVIMITAVGNVYAEEEAINRHELAWGLFYKMMTAAFIVGAVVQGTLVYIIFRFRERKVKGKSIER